MSPQLYQQYDAGRSRMRAKRVLGLALLALAAATNVSASDLIAVYEDALTNDPQLRAADANRLAQREARPQAFAALLPQLSGMASIMRDNMSGTADTQSVNADNQPILV